VVGAAATVHVRGLTLGRRNDAKSVSIMALGCFHPVLKVQSASLHFFLGSDDDQPDSDDEDDDVSDCSQAW
jgi:hypothetical protein